MFLIDLLNITMFIAKNSNNFFVTISFIAIKKSSHYLGYLFFKYLMMAITIVIIVIVVVVIHVAIKYLN